MTVYLATKTLEKIDQLIEADQGNSYRQWLQKVLPHIGDAYRTDNEGFRSHLGASIIGQECNRKIWYDFRWFNKSNFSGRMIRLFNRGHLEEGRIIAALLMAGIQVYQQDANGNQYRISDHKGHFGGSGDGILIGVPDLDPNEPCLAEFKTHNAKSFQKLKDEGVLGAKPEHYSQMQIYLHKMNLRVALYIAVCKDNDEFYMELIAYDRDEALDKLERAGKIIWLQQAPKKISESPGWYYCKSFCNHYGVCHLGQESARNCRTCVHSEPSDQSWICNVGFGPVQLTKDIQLTGCNKYTPIK